jgi:hypothetical protein
VIARGIHDPEGHLVVRREDRRRRIRQAQQRVRAGETGGPEEIAVVDERRVLGNAELGQRGALAK